MEPLPGQQKERIDEVDILRGFAVLGICVINIPEMVGKGLAFSSSFTGSDGVLRLLYDMFVQTKFYTIFAFLFGLSFHLFMQSAERRGYSFRSLMSRRLLLLLVIGVVHGVFIWFGDVLHSYAILGFLLLLFYRRREKTLLIWSSLLLGLSALITIGSTLLALAFFPDELSKPLFHGIPGWEERAHFMLVYGTGNLFLMGPEILGLFLLGMYAGRKQWFVARGQMSVGVRRLQWISLVISLLLFIPMVLQYVTEPAYNSKLVTHYTFLSGKTMAVFYVCTLVRLIRALGTQHFGYLAAVGRMAFTNYLTQSIVTMLLLYVLWQNVGVWPLWAYLMYSLLLFSLQAVWSKWWLQSFVIGPLEWGWRAATYGKWPALRKQSAGASKGLTRDG
ncbi:DUF418 domain-containing protein [Paenibacillus xerothermodurans]|uniref:DUF418 domain-containing protein n=1 Tax=Paenibacillus xerothermodurans TaxID=1977292 RepID=A0A2W1NC52_PAEXE|nr:DUF418 domain-containing protein [Paenibacillus xerothermodurans]PZE20631.1 DUF418 domain-containing protein [Paenibacillus xerothermodurans]